MLRVEVELDRVKKKGLVDTGCSYTLISAVAARGYVYHEDSVLLETMEAKRIRTLGGCHVQSLLVGGCDLGPLNVQELQTLPLGVDVIVGLDVVLKHGLKMIPLEGQVKVEFPGEAQTGLSRTEDHKRHESVRWVLWLL